MENRKFLYIGLALAAILIIFTTTANAFDGAARARIVDGEYARIVDLGNGILWTVEELLDAHEITLGELDFVYPELDAQVHNGTEIILDRAMTVFIRINGDDYALIPRPARPGTTVAAFTRDYRLYTERDYVFETADWHTELYDGMIVNLQTRTQTRSRAIEPIPYANEYRYDDDKPQGERTVYIYGRAGSRILTTTIEHIGDRETFRNTTYEIFEQPRHGIVYIGNRTEPGEGQHRAACGTIFNYHTAKLVESTAYTLSVSCTGRTPDHPLWGVTASGMRAQVGVVAVDTNVIPFNTRMYIEGYGFAIAGDRGGAIRGNKIDVFKETMA